MAYHDLGYLGAVASNYADQAMEFKDPKREEIVNNLRDTLNKAIDELKNLKGDKELLAKEPDSLEEIRKLRPDGPRVLCKGLPKDYDDKLAGAFLSRVSGVILGSIVEAFSCEDMQAIAEATNTPYPPVDYWIRDYGMPSVKRYLTSYNSEYTRDNLNCVPVDDDVTYTILGLMIMEKHGIDFTVQDVGDEWVKYLPMAYTAEEVALNNCKKGIKADVAGDIDNAFVQYIGADIRCDPYAYVTPGLPEKAAELAYRDAMLSHRRNGVYGSMLFAAAQSAAFVVDDPIEAIEIGLTEIPKDCWLAESVRWALEERKNIHDWKEARAAIDKKFPGMAIAHVINNACLTVFGLSIGGTDVSKVLSETVAMGMDNDCTTGTAGSIVGAIAGKKNVDPHWYTRFNNTVKTYLNDVPELKMDDLMKRYRAVAEKVFAAQK